LIFLPKDTARKFFDDNIYIFLLKLKNSKLELNPASSIYAYNEDNRIFPLENFRRPEADRLHNLKKNPPPIQKEKQKSKLNKKLNYKS